MSFDRIQGAARRLPVDAIETPAQRTASAAAPAALAPEPEPISMGGLAGVYALAVLMLKTHHSRKESDQQISDAMHAAQDAADARELAAKRAEADSLRTAGLVGGLVEMGAGALQIGSTALSTSSELKKIRADQMPATAVKDKADLLNTAAYHHAAAGYMQASGTGHSAAGKILDGVFRGEQADRRVDADSAKQASERSARTSKEAEDHIRATSDDIRFVLDWVKQANQIDAQNTIRV
jgi:hypothetical protein